MDIDTDLEKTYGGEFVPNVDGTSLTWSDKKIEHLIRDIMEVTHEWSKKLATIQNLYDDLVSMQEDAIKNQDEDISDWAGERVAVIEGILRAMKHAGKYLNFASNNARLAGE